MAIAVADTNKNADRVEPVGVWYSRFEPWSSLTILSAPQQHFGCTVAGTAGRIIRRRGFSPELFSAARG